MSAMASSRRAAVRSVPDPAAGAGPGRPRPPPSAGRTHTRSRRARAPGARSPGSWPTGSPGRAAGTRARISATSRRPGRGEPVHRRDAAVAQRAGQGLERRSGGRGRLRLATRPGAGARRRRGRSNSSAPSASISSTSWPIGTLMAASCRQRAIGSPHASTSELPQPLAGGGDLGAVAVGAGAELPHRHQRAAPAVRPAQHHARRRASRAPRGTRWR